ncbi:MAG: [protein-PII] uridylyltransferase, partial [Rhodospirillales bacterium]|nr:[protein-PII] uridylyltransferase [Rhodospirillales bacterium]
MVSRIPKPRAIIDRKALTVRLEELAGWSGYSAKTQGEFLEIFKDSLFQGRAEIRRRFEQDGVRGPEVIHTYAFLIDQMIRTMHDFAESYVYPLSNPTEGERLTIIATGGYGRGELAPFSDIDLMFLLPYKQTAHTEQVVEFMLYLLWDLGLKVGHATRSIEDSIRLAREDITIRTSLLEARWLWGDHALYKKFEKRFYNEVVVGTGRMFVEAKLAERDQRHERMGDTRYVLEPNIKEGKGGLRDLQTLFWIAKYLYQVRDMNELVEHGILTKADVRKFAKAENFLWTVRCHLHYLADRPEERLSFNVQTEIGERMNYTDHAGSRGVERFMKHYFLIAKDVGNLTRVLCAVLEEDQKAKKIRFNLPGFPFLKKNVEGFRIDSGRVTVLNDDDFKNEPRKLIGIFHAAQMQDMDIHPAAQRLVTQNLPLIDKSLRADADANRMFMEILTSDKNPERALRLLNEAGVFGRFMTDFGRVIAQMQYDMYHFYTVDEHTIRAIGILHRIEKGSLKEDHPVSSAVIGEVQSRRALYLSVLLHDIAKGRGGDHSELGAKVALKYGPRFGLNDWETETVSWLVLHHLRMSDTAFKRDLDDPKTVSDFVEIVQSPERLRMLLILTVADIRAVGPAVWNAWKATLLRELYYRSMEIMTGGLPAERRDARVERARAALREKLSGWTEDEIAAHLARGYAEYWLSYDTATHLLHAKLIAEAEGKGLDLHMEFHADPSRDATEVIIYTPDHPGLFTRIAGAMSLAGASIVDAKIVTLTNGMALDTFRIQNPDGSAFAEARKLERLKEKIGAALAGKLDPVRELKKVQAQALPSRTRVFKVPPRVLIDNKASATHTVIEINGRDRPGLLRDLTAALTGLGLQIASAHISTYGERVVDVFYVKDVFGLKADQENKKQEIEARLLAAITRDAEAA